MLQPTHNANVIRKRDPNFPEFMNFEQLRKLGLEHLGHLSGNVWTDHNLHDPGITILEALIYALLDLGYRTQLPIEDLLANAEGVNNDLFTPARILANHPLTIIDYRKLLMDIPGVKNAWLTVVDDANLYYDRVEGNDYRLLCNDPNPDQEEDKPLVQINGLYRVAIEIDLEGLRRHHQSNSAAQSSKLRGESLPEFDPVAAQERLYQTIKRTLQAHRNLGEDFVEVKLLCREAIELDIDLELENNTQPEAVLVALRRKLARFFSPGVDFYTLNELLEKGRSLEDAFAGRPYRANSHGFIDTQELEAVQRRHIIYRSDLYHLINSIDGVKRVRALRFTAFNDLSSRPGSYDDSCGNWSYLVCGDCTPFFAEDRSTINFFKGASSLVLNQRELQKLERQAGSAFRKVAYDRPELLDKLPQPGTYREDLGDYRSIQQDLPANYRVGVHEVSASAPLSTQARSRQLRAFLLFFDQLLAGYLLQLKNLGTLFSAQPDADRTPDQRHTQFASSLDDIPGIAQLLRFYASDEQYGWRTGTTMAVPVRIPDETDKEEWLNQVIESQDLDLSFCQYADGEAPTLVPYYFSEHQAREQQQLKMQRELQQGQYQLSVVGQDCAFYFVLALPGSDVCLMARHPAADIPSALEAGETLAFLGSLNGVYQRYNERDAAQYSYHLVFQATDHQALLQQLTETPEQYCEQRDQMLDHLLARFGEVFTDYSLLLFDQDEKEIPTAGLNAKAGLLNDYATLSSRRGQAFNTCCLSWNTDNVAGVSNKTGALLGFDAGSKRLANIVIAQYEGELLVIARNAYGEELLRSSNSFRQRSEALALAEDWHNQLQAGTGLEIRQQGAGHRIWINLGTAGEGKHPKLYTDYVAAQEQELSIRIQFACEPQDEQIVKKSDRHYQLLYNTEEKAVRRSLEGYLQREEALADATVAGFTNNINEQEQLAPPAILNLRELPRELLPDYKSSTLQPERLYLDITPWEERLKVRDTEFQWQWRCHPELKVLRSVNYYATEADARRGFVEDLMLVTTQEQALKWEWNESANTLELYAGNILIATTDLGDHTYDKVIEDWQQCLEKIGNCILSGSAFGWAITNDRLRLNSDCLYRSESLAQQAGQEAIEQKAELEWKIVEDDELNRRFRLDVFDKNGTRIAYSEPIPSSQLSPEEAVSLLQEKFHERAIDFPKVDPAYFFQLNHSEHGVILRSMCAYRDPLRALDEMLHLQGTIEETMAMVDDSMQYGYLLVDKNGKIVAVSAENVDDRKLFETLVEAAEAALKNKTLDLSTLRWCRYQLCSVNGKDVLLESARTFANKGLATQAMRKFLLCLADKERYEIQPFDESQRGFRLVVLKGDNKVEASTPEPISKARAEQLEASLLREIRTAIYCLVVQEEAFEWCWRLPVENNPYESVDWWYSKIAYRSRVEAKTTLFKAYAEVSTTTALPTGWEYRGPEAMRPVGEERFEMLSEHRQRFANKEEDPKLGGWVMLPNETDDRRFAYRLQKRDEPLAFHPDECWASLDNQEITTVENRLCGINAEPIPWLRIARGVEAVVKYTDEDGKVEFRYQIKGRYVPEGAEESIETVFLESCATFTAEAEAVAAFEEAYLEIIHHASWSCGFIETHSDNQCKEMPRLKFGTPTDIEKKRYQLLAYAVGDWQLPENRQSLWYLMQSFPIRLYTNPCVVRDCEDPIEYQYYFRLGYRGSFDGAASEQWRSFRTYSTPQAAWRDFYRFLELLNQPNTCNTWRDETAYLDCWRKLKQLHSDCQEHDCCQSDEDEALVEPTLHCNYFLTISEVLLESKQRFKRLEETWGESDYLAIENQVYENIEEAQYAIQRWPIIYAEQPLTIDDCATSDNEPVLRIDACGELRYYFTSAMRQGGEGVLSIFNSFTGYTTREAAIAACAQLAIYVNNFGQEVGSNLCDQARIIRTGPCQYRIVIIALDQENWQVVPITNVVAQSTKRYKSLLDIAIDLSGNPDNPFSANCLSLLSEMDGLNWDCTQSPLVLQDGDEQPLFTVIGTLDDATISTICESGDNAPYLFSHCLPFVDLDGYYRLGMMEEGPGNKKASGLCETRGLLQMLEAAGRPNSIEQWYDEDESRRGYRFAVVGRNYRLARHLPPFASATDCASTRLALLTQYELGLPECCVNPTALDVALVPDSMFYKAEVYNVNDGPVFDGPGDWFISEAAATQTAVEALMYAREWYYLNLAQQTTFAEDDHSPLALLSYWLDEDGSMENLSTLQSVAQCYPYSWQNGGYVFSIWETNESTPQLPAEQCLDEAVLALITETPDPNPGRVVWESLRSYRSLDEAKCFYGLFCAGLSDAAHYRCITSSDCSEHELIFVLPDEIYAEHPAAYRNHSDLLAAIQRTQECLFPEGLHLLEHILLRPEHLGSTDIVEPIAEEDCNCLLPIFPNTDCKLIYQDEDAVDCAAPTDADPCGEGGGNADVYVPGTDPYSFWVTVTLPGWGRRFGQKTFRETLQATLRREAPAHIGLRFMWLSPRDMFYFEDVYQPWLKYLQGAPKCSDADLVCDLVDCLVALKCTPASLTIDSSQNNGLGLVSADLPPQAVSIADQVVNNLFSPPSLPFFINQLGPVGGILTTTNWILSPTVTINNDINPIALGPGQLIDFDFDASLIDWINLEPPRIITPIRIEWPGGGNVDSPGTIGRIGRLAGGLLTTKGSKERPALASSIADTTPPPTDPEKKKQQEEEKSPAPVKAETARETTEKLTSAAIRKRIRGRKKRLQDALDGITNRYFKQTNQYKAALDFLAMDGSWDKYESFIDELLIDRETRNKADYETAYTTIVQVVTAYMLDQLVLATKTPPAEKAKALRVVLRRLKDAGFDRTAIRNYWQGEQLNEWINGNTIEDYLKILRR